MNPDAIIVSTDGSERLNKAAKTFAKLLQEAAINEWDTYAEMKGLNTQNIINARQTHE